MPMLVRLLLAAWLLPAALTCAGAQQLPPPGLLLGADPLPIGSIIAFGGRMDRTMQGELLRAGWLPCDGRPLATRTGDGKPTVFANLFRVIGTNFGAGYDGAGHRVGVFNVPDLRGRFLRGVAGVSGRDPDASRRLPMRPGGARGNEVGSIQGQALLRHRHVATAGISEGGGVFVSRPIGQSELQDGMDPGPSFSDGGVSGITRRNISVGVAVGETGGNETRPINANVNWIIKYR